MRNQHTAPPITTHAPPPAHMARATYIKWPRHLQHMTLRLHTLPALHAVYGPPPVTHVTCTPWLHAWPRHMQHRACRIHIWPAAHAAYGPATCNTWLAAPMRRALPPATHGPPPAHMARAACIEWPRHLQHMTRRLHTWPALHTVYGRSPATHGTPRLRTWPRHIQHMARRPGTHMHMCVGMISEKGGWRGSANAQPQSQP